MTELEHLQKVILSIAKDIDKLCRENGIEYYLLGGSAIGAIRHKGFIPWDDDFDIIMDNTNYNKFIEVCKTKLDTSRYYLYEGIQDWPCYFSKIKLKNTELVEFEGENIPKDKRGIYIDIFKMDNVSSNPIIARWQYFCGKLYLSYQLSTRTYTSASLKKKLLMILSFPLKISAVRKWIVRQIEKYNHTETEYYGFFYGRTRWKSAVIKRAIYGKPIDVPFEDTHFLIAEQYHEYLTQVFGDYMKLPPESQRTGLHLVSVDFGKY